MAELDVRAVAQTGMAFERNRIEAASLNIARANVVSSTAAQVEPLFMAALSGEELQPGNVKLTGYMKSKAIYQPAHPLADKQGFIYMPDIDLAHEMVTLSSAKRAYEANIKVYNSYKEMSAKALEIGK
ncbi:putative flagellar basal body rod protein FlgC [Shewanella denitrificans OS217]|jgi:flagellar basal-body rod protein FlgC|uniref:Putative flagellar basal body rod protein FlgC n=1 Tax=Shewanella denitrificans (strain OS217 / ATCC BAA-1090 / DSM 15013) TaxID=318161 RepID=Q12T78_SHEDO|nr:flagellar basal body rod C-terminal domain-containing protein [Shewanella denitrificans]ABE53348.1 putative flagellar basal body rod protein FlgC [Shewanella denitrificans OS217]